MRSATDINQHYRTMRPQLLMYMVIGYAAFYLTRKSVNYVLKPCWAVEQNLHSSAQPTWEETHRVARSSSGI